MPVFGITGAVLSLLLWGMFCRKVSGASGNPLKQASLLHLVGFILVILMLVQHFSSYPPISPLSFLIHLYFVPVDGLAMKLANLFGRSTAYFDLGHIFGFLLMLIAGLAGCVHQTKK